MKVSTIIRKLPQTQEKEPHIKERIDRVGVEGIRTHLTIRSNGGEIFYLPEIDILIDLPGNKKGIHMSRLVETINEVLSGRSEEVADSLEHFGDTVLAEIQKKHPYESGEIAIRTLLVLHRTTPVSGKVSDEPYDVQVRVIRQNGHAKKYVEVRAVGSTLCPHSLELTGGRAHIQRAEARLGITTSLDTPLTFEKLIEICEKSFSAPTYTVLKSEDEKYLVETMFANPRFVEDLAREMFEKVKLLGIEGRVRIKATSYESIHKHNAVSEIERELKPIR